MAETMIHKCVRHVLATTSTSSFHFPSPLRLLALSNFYLITRCGAKGFSTFTTHRTVNPPRITVSPTDKIKYSALVIISHGLGDTSEGFVDVAEYFAGKIPHVKFILPTAPTRPVSMNMGMRMPSWYDITGLDERSNEVCIGINQSEQTLSDILDEEYRTYGIPYHRMVLAGFSQGGALSLYTGFRLPVAKRLAGIVVMSGYLPNSSQFRITPGLEDTPVIHCHGSVDPMVKYAVAVQSQQFVTMGKHGATNYNLQKYEGVEHTVSMDELVDIQAFLERVLPMDTKYLVQIRDPEDMTVKELRELIEQKGLVSRTVGMMEKWEFVKLVKDYQKGDVFK